MKFDIDVAAKKWTISSLGKKWTDYKCNLKCKYFNPCTTQEERDRLPCSDNVDARQWRTFICLWELEEGQLYYNHE